MRVGVVVFPGSNCDADCFHALNQETGLQPRYVWHRQEDVSDCDALVLPGGFSFGDYLRPGAIARFSPVLRGVSRAAAQGLPVLGICNGFQILLEAGLLPGALVSNRGLRFVCRYTRLRLERTDTPFTRVYEAGELLPMPVAHGDGCYTCDRITLQRLEEEQRVVLRYVDDRERPRAGGEGPNGSLGGVAGVCNARGNVVGIMPHPERCADPLLGSTRGRGFFRSLLPVNGRGEEG